MSRKSVATIFRTVDPDAFERWAALLWESCGVDPNRRQPFHDRIAESYGISLPDDGAAGSRLLFSLQTFYAEIVKETVRKKLGVKLSEPFFSWTKPEIPDDIFEPDGPDFFGPVYQNLYPAPARRALGEFYTPDWMAEDLVRQIGRPDEAFLDPACGSGTFLLATVREMRRKNIDTKTILKRIRGFDLNPLAVLMARANLTLALDIRNENKIPVFLKDSILDEPAPDEAERFHVVGNPPWLNWDRLPKDYREKTRPLWERYGLFSLSGNEARHGGAKKELAQLMILRVADRYLKSGGRLAMVLPATVFRTRQAGEGFRMFRLPDGTPLGVLRVDDYSGMPKNPFKSIGTKPATILFEKGVETEYPVRFCRRMSNDSFEELQAEPISGRPGTPWIVGAKSETKALGPSEYRAFLGANSGGANGVFWVEILGPSETSANCVRIRNLPECGKLSIRQVETEIEKELVYPLLRWGDVDRFETKIPSRFLILPQDIRRRTGIPEDVMEKKYPKTLAYLRLFEPELRRRAAFRKYQADAPFYSMYNVGEQTVASIKVVWRRMDTWIRAAAVEPLDDPLLGRKPVIPQETCVLIPCESPDEARYLVQRLNGPEVDQIVRSLGVAGSKGFGSPGILEYLGIRRFDRSMQLGRSAIDR